MVRTSRWTSSRNTGGTTGGSSGRTWGSLSFQMDSGRVSMSKESSRVEDEEYMTLQDRLQDYSVPQSSSCLSVCLSVLEQTLFLFLAHVRYEPEIKRMSAIDNFVPQGQTDTQSDTLSSCWSQKCKYSVFHSIWMQEWGYCELDLGLLRSQRASMWPQDWA